jgi:fructose-1,6-bisphosphatase/inositol monophosphatase family enzyme
MAMENWDKIEISKQKDSRDIATVADIKIENFFKDKIIGMWPEHGFWGEEGERSNELSDYQWLVDPIDQTKLYAKQVPIFFVQIALQFKKKSVLGLIYNPVSKQLFSAFKGNGAFLNNKHILPNPPVSFDKAIIDMDFRSFKDQGQKEEEWMLEKMNKVVEKSYRVRMSGGALNIYLVTGAFDAYIRLEDETKLQDVAPRVIIMEEAGYITEWVDTPFGKKIMIVSQEPLLSEIKEIMIK